MPKLVTKLVVLSRPGTVAVLWGSLALLIVAATPARAQDLFGFFRVLFRPVAPVPAYQPFEYRAVPVPERPLVRPRPKAVRLEQPPIKMPTKPKAPGEVVNPLPELLADSTLRPGDLVMFPDGLRAFTGQPGSRHTLADFEPLSRAGKAVSSSTRRLVSPLRPGANAAWSAQSVRSGGKLAVNARDIEPGGSLERKDR